MTKYFRKHCIILLILFASIILYGCKKNDTIQFNIVDEQLSVAINDVTIEGKFEYTGTVYTLSVEYSINEDLTSSTVIDMDINGRSFGAHINGLSKNTKYYYRYLVDYGVEEMFKTNINSFHTLSDVITIYDEIIEPNYTEICFDGAFTFAATIDEIQSVDIHLIRVSDHREIWDEATISDNHFSCCIPDLESNTDYLYFYDIQYTVNQSSFVSHYITDSVAISTKPYPTIVIQTKEATKINDPLIYQFHGVIIDNGGSNIVEYGFCYSTDENPTCQNGIKLCVGETSCLGEYDSEPVPLQELSTYYVKSYALTDFGLIVYGEEKSFTTYYFLPTVVTERITGFSEHFATINASYTLFTSQNEDCFIHEAGFCWSTHPNPTIDDNVVSSTQFSSFSGNRFSNTITDLGFSQTYYVRAFLSTNHGLSCGQVLTFNSYIDSNRPYGSLNGIFSVASNKKIRFSKGNLIYDNGVFRFADYQYDIPMEQWDLFGWATSGCPGSQSPTCTAAR